MKTRRASASPIRGATQAADSSVHHGDRTCDRSQSDNSSRTLQQDGRHRHCVHNDPQVTSTGDLNDPQVTSTGDLNDPQVTSTGDLNDPQVTSTGDLNDPQTKKNLHAEPLMDSKGDMKDSEPAVNRPVDLKTTQTRQTLQIGPWSRYLQTGPTDLISSITPCPGLCLVNTLLAWTRVGSPSSGATSETTIHDEVTERLKTN
ncbi:hypothetical protein D5F01_LYC05721 [Larimichthys crocea]|uniref:Uncharacterized protein n=1 Tax=Larimichthys crocea TaxID=215358 RepID=A0A6G0ITZ2_LARCR|nr:hypothetical protein D5F01_LYC05721 [Larimichthys crocea]